LTIVQLLAALTKRKVHRIALSPSVDAAELLGCWEQADPTRSLRSVMHECSVLAWHGAAFFVLAAGEAAPKSALAAARLKHAEAVLNSYWALRTRTLSADALSAERPARIDGTRAASPLQLSGQLAMRLLQAVTDALSADDASALAASRAADARARGHLVAEARRLARELQKLVKKCDRAAMGTKKKRQIFEWVDSPLVKAMQVGDWVLLENVNHCSPTVLDRLNPLLERQGEGGSANGLAIHECGPIRVKKKRHSQLPATASAQKRVKREGGGGADGVETEIVQVRFLLFTVTFYANLAHNLTRSPSHI
jgi:midasin